VSFTGSLNATVQYTLDDVFGAAPGPFTWFAASAPLAAITVSPQSGTLLSPVTAVRLLTNSGGGTATMRLVQSGLVA
jgi:hypothetical protein